MTQGTPDALLQERYPGIIIELPLADIVGTLDTLEHRVIEDLGIVEVISADVGGTLERLQPIVSNLNNIKIRQPNLEDLFLDLTGHTLRA